MVPIPPLPVLPAPRGSRYNEATCTESDNANVSSDVNPANNVDEMDSDSDLAFEME